MSLVEYEDAKHLWCVICGSQEPGSMRTVRAAQQSPLNQAFWKKHFGGSFRDYVLNVQVLPWDDEETSLLALCPAHYDEVDTKVGGVLLKPIPGTRAENLERMAKRRKRDHLSGMAAKLWEDRDAFADFRIRCQGTELRAHRFVLAKASPVFAAMLGVGEGTGEGRATASGNDIGPPSNSGPSPNCGSSESPTSTSSGSGAAPGCGCTFIEGETQAMEIHDAYPDAVTTLVRFAYTGEVCIAGTEVGEKLPAALRLADKYGMESMSEAICEEMLRRLDVSNVTSFLRALKRYEKEPMLRTKDRLGKMIRRNDLIFEAVIDAL